QVAAMDEGVRKVRLSTDRGGKILHRAGKIALGTPRRAAIVVQDREIDSCKAAGIDQSGAGSRALRGRRAPLAGAAAHVTCRDVILSVSGMRDESKGGKRQPARKAQRALGRISHRSNLLRAVRRRDLGCCAAPQRNQRLLADAVYASLFAASSTMLRSEYFFA